METSHDANGHPVLFTEEEFREMLDKQVKHNDTLQQKLDKSQSELKKARERIKEFDNAVAKMPSVDTDPQELLAQIALRDSIITCLQQELALVKAEKNRKKEERPKTGEDSLEQHLLRAKARSQAIAEQKPPRRRDLARAAFARTTFRKLSLTPILC
eukprot:CAMPEP_0177694634 /NCGR_PEP_ID=MMETSP0484_2-20121128/3036_1 /TAXON_ID=354590 /ORGANISM="Rhodomonas lens, Strain RHODO" /LENGTH=156 /DNA_ID=CAMNT_0019205521 /DNA_START=57 /DNA_END=527 /DNA_ORIENTATION=-